MKFVALPDRRAVKVDHLVADVDRHDVRVLGDVEPERPVERHHRVGVLHRQRDMVEATDRSAGSGLIGEAVEPGAVGRGDLAAVGGGQRAERLLDRVQRVGERAVGVRVVGRPHARVGAEERDELRAERVLLEGRDTWRRNSSLGGMLGA